MDDASEDAYCNAWYEGCIRPTFLALVSRLGKMGQVHSRLTISPTPTKLAWMMHLRMLITMHGKGGKNRRRGKNENENEKRELVFKEDGQEYAQVTKMLGNGRLEAMCFDGMKRLCHIRGKLRKKVWITGGDIILLGLRDYQDTKADVILKYTPDEARNLKAYGELPEHARINENPYDEDGDENIEFGDFDGDDDEIDDVSRDFKRIKICISR
ncbi:hypothetical protein FSP39_012474 [Pinctada imbricata]|uniref:Eukaryotic translation initiation factor 4C n=1 Tax=Pinctada imbricata TaxID=66713 RepID=A0AA89BX64_PINIB|nr:hypothetical protein FSP39_012474 [Pinctada imbricata]